jgi:hypothetical protein
MVDLPPDHEPPGVIAGIEHQAPYFGRLPQLILDDLIAPGTGVGADGGRIRG